MVDCDTACYGCNGGWHDNAMIYAKGGITDQASYPYTASDGVCNDANVTMVTATTRVYQATYGSQNALVAAIKLGPVDRRGSRQRLGSD